MAEWSEVLLLTARCRLLLPGFALIADRSEVLSLTARCLSLLLPGPALIAEWYKAFVIDCSLSLTAARACPDDRVV